MSEEFDEREVETLIRQALAESDGAGSDSQSGSTLPLVLFDSRLLEVLSTKLAKYLQTPDIQSLLDDLRAELYTGIDIGSIKNLHLVTKNCRRCPAMIPEPHLPEWNKVDPDVVFISDLPYKGKEIIDYFVRCLRKAGFHSSRICLTYVNRCYVAEFRKPNAEEINNCSRYLLTELQLLKPKIIVPMGSGPASVLLGEHFKLTEEASKLYWLGPWQVFPIYSPTYVVKGAGKLDNTFQSDLSQIHQLCYGDR